MILIFLRIDSVRKNMNLLMKSFEFGIQCKNIM